MKTTNKLLSLLLMLSVLACSNEPISDFSADTENVLDETRENTSMDNGSSDSGLNEEHCVNTSLMAGQHYEAGSVTIDIVDGNLIVTYTVTEDWEIGTTHLSIGSCDDDWVPLTGSGNPQIGQFEFTEPTSITDNEVVYIIPLPEGDENEDY
ncbi:hypothetical protein [Winogradskyella sp.]|uniref:hypothetical protein n=1 Tax=Winogradskyella sp. TaxID=1883156 RepID=UPI001B17AC7B|nr:hypothetical protein [Winogradskyella sp.]MBO6881865.1 hypothetical protein [Winogradskyella sp.]